MSLLAPLLALFAKERAIKIFIKLFIKRRVGGVAGKDVVREVSSSRVSTALYSSVKYVSLLCLTM